MSADREFDKSDEDDGRTEEDKALDAKLTAALYVDPSTLKKGEPLTTKDWQDLYRFHRNPSSMSDEEKLRIIRLKRRFDTWYYANKEVFEQLTAEKADHNRRQN
jgi:hypothetical protein